MKENIYMCVANGFGKDGKPYSRYSRVVSITKDNKPLRFLDDKSPIYSDTVDPIGTIKQVTYSMEPVK